MQPRHTKVTVVDTGNGPVSIAPGQTMVIGRKWWGVCIRCRSLVRIDKPLLSSLHICVADDA